MTLGDAPVSWKTKKQPTVSRSSAETEYRAMASAASELIWLHTFLCDFVIDHSQPIQLFCDNQTAMHIASNSVYYEKAKHIEIECHFIREHIESKAIETSYIRSSTQRTDIFTKASSDDQFKRLLFKLDVSFLHIQLEGGY